MMHFNTQTEYNMRANGQHAAATHHQRVGMISDHEDCHQFDEADALMLGLEKSFTTSLKPTGQWVPEVILSGVHHLDSQPLFLEEDALEPFPLLSCRQEDQQRRSSDLRMFLDYVNRPPETLHPSTLLVESEPLEEEKKRSLKRSSRGEMSRTPVAKRSRTCNVIENSDDEECSAKAQTEETLPQIRDYQEQQWQEQYQALLEYKAKHGHCCVPNTYNPNPTLGRWVKRQRYQYKLRQAGQQSTLVASRVESLKKLGFVWDSHAALWEQRLNELKEYRLANGHCNVPSTYPKNPQLSTWVKCQRRQYKLTQKGKNSNFSEDRIATLKALGFVWDCRTINKNKKQVSAVDNTRSRRQSSTCRVRLDSSFLASL